jgi:glyoxylase-like metal-dependent hydrolase (beta-lactamase superfamily II)
MEVITSNHGANELSTKAIFSDEGGFSVASVLVMGKTDAALIDTQWTLANGHRVAAVILETGKILKTIYITHAHPDHYFGLGPITEAFPEAKVIALPTVAKTINKQMFGKIGVWKDIIGPTNSPSKAISLEPLTQNYFELEGQRLEIIPELMGDLKYNTAVWIPSVKTVVASDVLFNQSHPFTCEVTADERRQWIKDIERLEKMGAEVVIPGHQKEGIPLDGSAFKFTKDYLVATEEELEKTKDTGEFFYNMCLRFPQANLIFLSNEMNAAVFKGGREWNWRE